MEMMIRGRRNRRSGAIRGLVRENRLAVEDLILPVFFHDDANPVEISSMPGCTRWSVAGLVAEVLAVYEMGVRAVVLFPKIEDSLKSADAAECANDEGLVPRVIRELKEACPGLCVITDVALDPYNSDGHDGLVVRGSDGGLKILNDETVEVLCRQALCHARAGADIVAPSDMMDGRVGAIRMALDEAGFSDVGIMAYTAKYASAYYGPFRGALDSAPKEGDKKTYQMDPGNIREAVRELLLDEEEGADIVMVKPAGPYLDVIARLRDETTLPMAAYQVSGEYLMIKAACAGGWLDEKAVVMESLLGIKRAGADMILTYFAKDVARWLSEGTFR
ncbi:porphobilinogen synthase [Luteolibacter algae]|uniref:Delta-aminolevulinic acid dehydratase n=1 Tax=Luteolibacter algae TaxID=454151 RepID=A0ABW5D5V5_9BACT